MRIIQVSLLFLFSLTVSAQHYAGEYRSTSNPGYWKNRKPFDGYWQQDVNYAIKATIDEKTDIITASQTLTYYNNSPDTLKVVYFHLYNNAYQKDSYLDDLHRQNNVHPKYGRYGSQKQGTVVENLMHEGSVAKSELDNTILLVHLNKPLLPNESTQINLDFKTYFDPGTTVRNRMKEFNTNGFRHYDGVHWYPRVCVYDRKFGWETAQHLGREFYGDFGSYDVELTFANDYIVEATGVLQNEDEMLPADLKTKLQLKNFKDKPLGSAVTKIIERTGTKTWKYKAVNVHDFAFTADPSYRIDEVQWNGIRCIALAQEQNASRWQNAAEYLKKIIEVYSTDIGMYQWPKIIVADARDGMEYPMLTLDGGFDPDYRGLLAHEVGHQWFYGMIGNNETYRAALDEGFTQFLTAWSLKKIDGPYLIESPAKSSYVRKFKNPNDVIENRVYYGYMIDAVADNDPTLNTHSDDFDGALRQGGGYRHVYMKTAVMLYNLQYVLGDELFLKAIQHYFDQWKLCHPYFEDFRTSIISYTKTDLNWFFDQWLESTKKTDYAIKNVRNGKEKDQYIITFKRKGQMEMPIDFTVTGKSGKSYNYHIPNNWFVKETNATVLPRWIGWGKLKPAYKATITIPEKIKEVSIDTSLRLADINQLNNSTSCKAKWSFDHRIYNQPSRKHYQVNWRPDIWYNSIDGVKAGLHFNGAYMNYKHKFEFTAWYNTGAGIQTADFGSYPSTSTDPVSYNFTYRTATNKILKNSDFFLNSRFLDGLISETIGLEFKSKDAMNRYYVFGKAMIRPDDSDTLYVLLPGGWMPDKWNNTINTGVDHKYNYKRGEGLINLNLRSSTLFSDYNYAQLSLTVINHNKLGKVDFRTRFFAQYSTGITPEESMLYLSGANPEEMADNKFVRSKGIVPSDWTSYGVTNNHFHYGGGLNLRGYSGYVAAEEEASGNVSAHYRSNTGMAFNGELDFSKLVGLGRAFFKNTLKFDTYFFGDAGTFALYPLSWKNPEFIQPRIDAGAGVAMTIQRWGPLQLVSPLTLRLDAPFFLNRPPAADAEYLKLRWVVGVSRAF